jgi:hypothetical protein
MDPQLSEIIKTQRAAGASRTDIEKTLRIQGFTEEEIQSAFGPGDAVHTEAQPSQAEVQQTPTSVPAPAPLTPPVSKMTISAPSHRRSTRALIIVLPILILLCILGGVAYAYVMNVGPFAHMPYNENNLISGILNSSAHIDSSSYRISGSIKVVPRDADARPFAVQTSNEEQIRLMYENDAQRAKSINAILPALRTYKGAFPPTLQQVISSAPSYYGASKASLRDPKTKAPYIYRSVSGGKDFQLTVSFETADALASIKRFEKYSSSTVEIVGQTVTFSKNSDSYVYVSSEPPKPFIVQLGEWMRFLSPDVSASLGVSAASNWKNSGGEWKFNIDAVGDFGDLSYKVNADALKKGDTYYFRINNLPSLGFFDLPKGQWVKISPSAASSSPSSFSTLGFLASSLPKEEKNYKERRAALVDYIKKIAAAADREHVFQFKRSPATEFANGKILYRYDLKVQKSAVLPFYQDMLNEAKNNESVQEYDLFNDPGTIDYLKSDEFSQVFDYIDKNTQVALWVDPQGYPEKLEYTMRVVPPDTAQQLKDKQVIVVLEMDISDINVPVTIDVPKDAKDIEDLINQSDANDNYSLDSARTNGRDARRIADIKQLQLALELYQNEHSAYPGNLSALAPTYIAAIPKDPTTSQSYVYAALGSGSTCSGYHLGAVLESTNSALSNDDDASVKSMCAASAHADFNGRSSMCSGSASGATDRCYDVGN